MRKSLAIMLLSTGIVLVGAAPVAAVDSDGDGLHDWFERKWGVTDPNRRDSDRDGVIDSAEDNDRDRLSNLAEQRYRTDPGAKDTDGDGTADGAEDKDGDGKSNAREQDRRPLPQRLTPSLSRSRQDVPPRKSSCISKGDEDFLRPCRFGTRSSKTVVVLFGDSHAFHWLPALDRVGKAAGLRIVTLAKGSCKSATLNLGVRPKTACARWRRKAIRWIREQRPDAVLLANAAPFKPSARATWQEALETTLRALPDGTNAAVISDTPRPPREVALCLKRFPRNMAACQFRRGRARSLAVVRDDQAAAAAQGALHASFFDKVCSYDPCPLVQGNKLVYRGVHHLTATISRQLAPSVRRVVLQTLALEPAETADVATLALALETDLTAEMAGLALAPAVAAEVTTPPAETP